MTALGGVGIWTRQLDTQPGSVAMDAARQIEALGYPTLWIPEAVEREVLTHAALLLGATTALTVATGVARVHSRVPLSMGLAQLLLSEVYPERFLLGLGVSHPGVVRRQGQEYGRPLEVMGEYLDALDAVLAAPHPALPASPPQRVLAALGPKMLRLAATRAAGAHTYLSPVAHTAWARAEMGPGPLLIPSLKVVLEGDAERARDIGRLSVGPPLRMPAYSGNLARFGLDARGVGDAVVDALVAWGDPDAIAARVQAHLDAGADHVCIEVLTGDDTTVPLAAWTDLAPALLAIKEPASGR